MLFFQFSVISYQLSVVCCQRYEVWSMMWSRIYLNTQKVVFCYQLPVIRGMKYEVWGAVMKWSKIISIPNTQIVVICYQLSVVRTWKKAENFNLALNCPLSLFLALGSVISYQLSELGKKQKISNKRWIVLSPWSLIFVLGSRFLAPYAI